MKMIRVVCAIGLPFFLFWPSFSFAAGPLSTEVQRVITEIRPQPDLSLVEKFLKEVPQISDKQDTLRNATDLSRYIFKHWKIEIDNSYEARNNKDNILPDSVLSTRKGHCVGLTTLFLMAAEQAGLEAYLVRGPSHVFPRLCANSKCVNVEMLRGGEIKEDRFYIENLFIPQGAISEKIYLESLPDPKQLVSTLYLSMGYVAYKYKQTNLAQLFYQKAVDTAPRFADPHTNLGAVYSNSGSKQSAQLELKKAYELNPYHFATVTNLGVLYFENKDYAQALEYLNKSIELNPLSVESYFLRAKVYLVLTSNNKRNIF